MKQTSLLLIVFLITGKSIASEITLSLEEKIQSSNIVAIGTVLSVEKGKIGKHKGYGKTQETLIDFEIIEHIKGASEDTVQLLTYSVSYDFETERGFGTTFSTAGFSSYRIKPAQQYVAYFKETEEGSYTLSGNSNQYLEWIDTEQNLVRDIGQTIKMVPLSPKIETLRTLSKAQSAETLNSDAAPQN